MEKPIKMGLFYPRRNMAFRWGILLINEPGNNSLKSLGGD